ncbi:MAG TPA: SCO family protein [Pyrinomonadaceae bacterium]|nr:SCO family protein [Pyrinomonadaceae bacterium]
MAKLKTQSLLCCCLLLLCTVGARAQQQKNATGHSHGHQPVTDSSPSVPARLAIPDVEILDQNGKKQRLYTDLVKGRKVVINFIYTSCTSYCPLSGDNFARLQALLGKRMIKDVYLLSISTDPETDTPAKLKAWSARFGPKPGWTLVTGETPAMQTLLKAFLGEGPRRGEHTPIAFVLNDERGGWQRTFGLESPEKLLEILGEFSAPARK